MPRPIVIASMMREHGATGVQTHARAVLAWLFERGRPVSLVTPFGNPAALVYPVFGFRRLLDRTNPPAGVWWYRHWHAVFLERGLRRVLRDGAPCTVYAQCPLSARAALRACVSPEQKVVMVAHFNLSQADEWADKGAIARDGALFRAIRDLEAEVLPAVDGLVFVSAFMQRAILERLPAVARVPMAVVPNFVADPGTSPRAEKAQDLITVGTLEYRKNQRYALEIVRAARQLGTELTLTVVGDGPDRPMLEKLVRELGIAKQVRFAGFVPDAAGLMPAHRACLHVARMENFPIVLIESMCRGLPVFAPAAGGIPEMFDDGQQGRQIPLDDAEAAARLIVDWMNDAPTLARAGDAARRCYLERFEADRSASRLAAFLDQAGSA